MAMKIYSNTTIAGQGNIVLDDLFLADGTPAQVIVTSEPLYTGVTIMVDDTKSAEKEELTTDLNTMLEKLCEIMRETICENTEDCDTCLFKDRCLDEMEGEDYE